MDRRSPGNPEARRTMSPDFTPTERDLYERLRAKGIRKKHARRIATAPDLDADATAAPKVRKAARKAARGIAGAADRAERVTVRVADERPGNGRAPAAEASPGPGGALRAALERAGATPARGPGAPRRLGPDRPGASARRTAPAGLDGLDPVVAAAPAAPQDPAYGAGRAAHEREPRGRARTPNVEVLRRSLMRRRRRV
jgi:hypothetical protein